MPEEVEIVDSHRTYLYVLGAVSAVIGALVMLRVSLSIFNSYRNYLDKLFPLTQQMAALNKNDEDGVNCKIYEEGKKKKKRSRKKSKSPVKKRIISPRGAPRAHDSVSSFRALLDGDSNLHPFPAHNSPAYELSSGYDSGAQVSMSTQANLLNMSVTSQQATTARDH